IRPFRWTAADGMQDLGAPPGMPEGASRVPEYMSSDGRVIIGEVRLSDPAVSYPFRWTEATGMQLLVGWQTGYATYLSPSGDVVMGNYSTPDGRGFRWTEATGAQDIDYPSWPGIG